MVICKSSSSSLLINNYTFKTNTNTNTRAFSSGCAAFYNTSLTPNTSMTRIFDEDRFEIHAVKDIEANEELTHKYKSLEWRSCWTDLREHLNITDKP